MKSCFYVILMFLLSIPYASHAQRVSISTDPIRWATLSPNTEVEVTLSKHLTIDFLMSINTMDKLFLDDIRLKHICFGPELRYWFKNIQYSHYVGAGMEFIMYDVALNKKASEGMLSLIKISYGYSFILSNHWNLTPYISGGFGLNRSVSYEDESTGVSSRKFGIYPTGLGVAFTYIIN